MSTPPNDNTPQWGAPGQQPGEQPGQQPGEQSGEQLGQQFGQQGGPYGAGEQYPQGTGDGASKFGTAGYDPSADYGAPMSEPKKYQSLKMMTLVSMIIYGVSQLIGLIPLTGDTAEQTVREELEAMGLPATDQDVSTAISTAMGFVVVLLVLSIALYLVVYFGLRAKKGWARILGVVLAVLGMVVTFFSLVSDPAAFGDAMGMISVALLVAWVAVNVYWAVLAFSSPVSQYLEQQR